MLLQAQLDSRARLTVPPEVRARLHVDAGDTVLFVERGTEMVLTTLTALKERAYGAWAEVDYSSEDLLADRRAAARREEGRA